MENLKWKNENSAREMSQKYNALVEEVKNLKLQQNQVNNATKEALEELRQEFKKQFDTLGLYVDEDGDICQKEVVNEQ